MYSLTNPSHFPLLPLATTVLFCASVNLTILDFSFKWYVIFVCVWLISHSVIFSRSIHVVVTSGFFKQGHDKIMEAMLDCYLRLITFFSLCGSVQFLLWNAQILTVPGPSAAREWTHVLEGYPWGSQSTLDSVWGWLAFGSDQWHHQQLKELLFPVSRESRGSNAPGSGYVKLAEQVVSVWNSGKIISHPCNIMLQLLAVWPPTTVWGSGSGVLTTFSTNVIFVYVDQNWFLLLVN